MLAEIIQTVATGSAVALGITYIVGGLIVNLNLARRGLVEYQILKIKYLVVGLIFLLHAIGTFAFAAIPALALAVFANDLLLLQGLNGLSLIGAISMLIVWARLPSSTPSFLGKWNFWFIASALGATFPMLVLIRQVAAPRTEAAWIAISIQAVLTAALTFLSQVYHYSAFYYGRPNVFGALDPLGVGLPIRVQLACEPESLRLLQNLGVKIEKEGVTADVFLLDETDQHYIVSLEPTNEAASSNKTLKIEKEGVKAILYKPDYMRPLGKKTIPSKKK